MDGKKRKVTIVGAGAVGSTFAYALAQSGYADEIAITDMNKNFARKSIYMQAIRLIMPIAILLWLRQVQSSKAGKLVLIY